MKYDFTSIMDRHGKDAIAVDLVGMYQDLDGRQISGYSTTA